MACSSGSFSELCPPTPEPSTKEMFYIDANQLKIEPENPLTYTELNSFENFVLTPSTSTAISQEFNFDPITLAAFEHDYGFLSKRSTIVDTPSPSPTISKRTPTRAPRRTSSRLQSHHVNRATDIKTEDDLSYYLERRRKNNEASKMSRAARKQKFGDMDSRW
jgi:hypothetical protein